MWIPKSEEEILERLEAGDLQETAAFDAKRELGKSTKEIAKDIAAMATDGGSIVYGIGEDENERLTVAAPFRLKGATERIANIVQTGVQEPVDFRADEIPCASDAAMGYLVLAIPASPLAPHMVIIGGDNRYYGRTATGNRRLTEGEVERLYARRRKVTEDADSFLDELMAAAPIEPREGFGYLHIASYPIFSDDSFITQAAEANQVDKFLRTAINSGITNSGLSSQAYPNLRSSYWRSSMKGWYSEVGASGRDATPDPTDILEIHIHRSGAAYLFCGRATDTLRDEMRVIFEENIAEYLIHFLHIVAHIYEAGGYVGPVNLGIAVMGIRGAYSDANRISVFTSRGAPTKENEYRRTCRTSGLTFRAKIPDIARELLDPFVHATTQSQYDIVTAMYKQRSRSQ